VQAEEGAAVDGDATAQGEDDGLSGEIAQDVTAPDDSTAVSDGEESVGMEGGETTDASNEIVDGDSNVPSMDADFEAPGAEDATLEASAAAAPSMEEADIGDSTMETPAPDLIAESTSSQPSMQMQPIVSAPGTKGGDKKASLSGSEGIYIVQPGDSLAEISHKIYGHNDAWQELAKVNNISSPYVIYPGNKIAFPTTTPAAQTFAVKYDQVPERTITVKQGDTLSSLAEKVFGAAHGWKIFTVYNEIQNPNLIEVGQTLSFKDPAMLSKNLSSKYSENTGDEAH
jgi:nucleoid-associated protein YgaU